jgi:hypothetical protein
MSFALRSTDAFDQRVVQWAGSMEHWDEIWFNFDHELVEHTYIGIPIPNTYLRALALGTNPRLTVYYHINERDQIINLFIDGH